MQFTLLHKRTIADFKEDFYLLRHNEFSGLNLILSLHKKSNGKVFIKNFCVIADYKTHNPSLALMLFTMFSKELLNDEMALGDYVLYLLGQDKDVLNVKKLLT